MLAILHNLVGLLHANMAIYYAYADRVPVFVVGATGPMDESKRRPRIDWIHTALVQGEAVRAYTRSEERRVGKECRSWWSPYLSNKNSYDSCCSNVTSSGSAPT